MSSLPDQYKNLDWQMPIPPVWRDTLSNIVEFIRGDANIYDGSIPGVEMLDSTTLQAIRENIEGYGATLVSLPESAWDTAACQWMGGYWELLVDLYTEEEGRSDLALSIRVAEANSGFRFTVCNAYVP